MNTSVDLVAIKKLRSALDDYIVNTPMVRCYDLEQRFSRNTKIFAKMEFFQHTAPFKSRGALTSLLG